MRKVLILQALPLEYYPPVTNLIRRLAGTGKFDLTVLALASPIGIIPFANEGVRIVRTPQAPSVTGTDLADERGKTPITPARSRATRTRSAEILAELSFHELASRIGEILRSSRAC